MTTATITNKTLFDCIRCDSIDGKATGSIRHYAGYANGICFACCGTGFVQLRKISKKKIVRAEYYTNPDGDSFLTLVEYSADYRHRASIHSEFVNGKDSAANGKARTFWRELLAAGYTIEGHDVNGATGKTWKLKAAV